MKTPYPVCSEVSGAPDDRDDDRDEREASPVAESQQR